MKRSANWGEDGQIDHETYHLGIIEMNLLLLNLTCKNSKRKGGGDLPTLCGIRIVVNIFV